MQKINTPPIFDVDELETDREWFERKGRSAFLSQDHLDWFIRHHQCELLKSGNYFPGAHDVPTTVGPDFGKAVIQIMQREAALKVDPE